MGTDAPRIKRKGDFVGKYNLTLMMKDGSSKHFKRVLIDNQQFDLGNFRITEENGLTTLIVRSDWSGYTVDSKNCS